VASQICDILRPTLATYALCHTPVSVNLPAQELLKKNVGKIDTWKRRHKIRRRREDRRVHGRGWYHVDPVMGSSPKHPN
jgi:hypothetical protein